MPFLDEITKHRDEILHLAHKHGCRDVRVFGSVARGEENQDSDIDFLINIAKDRSLLDLVGFKMDLEEIFHRKVDVVTETSLHWFIKGRIINEARFI